MSEPITLLIATGACCCGCGSKRSNGKRNFRQGHDRRFMAMLVEAELNQRMIELVTYSDTGQAEGKQVAPDLVAQRFLSSAGWGQYHIYLERAKNRKGKKAERKPAPAQMELPLNGRYGIGNTVRVKIGRWEYDAAVTGMNQEGEVTAVEYRDKMGNVKRSEKQAGKVTFSII